MTAFVVESPATNARGERVGTFRVYVGTEARAAALAKEKPGASWREVSMSEVPPQARAGIERTARG